MGARTLTASVIAALLCLGSVSWAEAAAFTKVTGQNETVRIGSHASWDTNCQGGPARVEIVAQPQHGHLSAQDGPITVTRVDRGSRRCLGQSIMGRVVFYTPQPGFVGLDQFYYVSISRKGTPIPHRGVVDVR